MKVRDFLVSIPGLCGARNADRIAAIFGYVFDVERLEETAFARNGEDFADFNNRSAYLWAMLHGDRGANPAKIQHCKMLMEIVERSHYLFHHGEKQHTDIIDQLVIDVRMLELENPEIATVFTADEAVTIEATSGGWNG